MNHSDELEPEPELGFPAVSVAMYIYNFIVLVKIYAHFELDPSNTFQKSWDGATKWKSRTKSINTSQEI